MSYQKHVIFHWNSMNKISDHFPNFHGNAPHCFSILPKICQQLPSELTGEEKVEMGWSCGKNGRWKTDRNQKSRKGKEKGSEEERKFDGMTDCALWEIWKD